MQIKVERDPATQWMVLSIEESGGVLEKVRSWAAVSPGKHFWP
jgi:hypothetical protein